MIEALSVIFIPTIRFYLIKLTIISIIYFLFFIYLMSNFTTQHLRTLRKNIQGQFLVPNESNTKACLYLLEIG